MFASTLLCNSNRWPLPVCHQSTLPPWFDLYLFFSWLIPIFWAGKTFWRTGFLAEILQLEIRVYLISSIRYQFDPDIWCQFYWFCYLFLFFRNKIGIFCVIMRRSLALKYYFGFKIFFFLIDKWKCIESFLQQLNS